MSSAECRFRPPVCHRPFRPDLGPQDSKTSWIHSPGTHQGCLGCEQSGKLRRTALCIVDSRPDRVSFLTYACREGVLISLAPREQVMLTVEARLRQELRNCAVELRQLAYTLPGGVLEYDLLRLAERMRTAAD